MAGSPPPAAVPPAGPPSAPPAAPWAPAAPRAREPLPPWATALLIGIGLLFLLPVLSMPMMMFGMGWGGWDGVAPWGAAMALVMLVPLALLVGAVLLVARLGRTDNAEAILDRRLAGGEIDVEEYRRRKEELRR